MRVLTSHSPNKYKPPNPIRNSQTVNIKAHDLERPSKSKRFDSTIDERERTYDTHKAEPRFSEYR